MAIGIGIVLEPRAARAVCLEKSKGSIRLLAAEEQPFDPAQADAVTRALRQLRQALRIEQPVFLGLPASAALITTVHPLIVNQSRADLAVQFELQQALPFKIEEVAWHHQWALTISGQTEVLAAPPRQAAQSARRLPDATAMVAAVKHETLNERLVACQRAGLKVAAVSVGPIALLNACATQRAAGRAKALTVLNLLDSANAEWVLWSSERFQIIPVGSVHPESLTQELAASWQSIQSQWPEVASTVTLAGPQDQMKAAEDALAAIPNLQIQRFDPAQSVVVRSNRPEAAQRSAAAIGLALQALGVSKFSFNVLDQAQHSQNRQWVRAASTASTFVCALAAFGLGAASMLEIRGQKANVLKAVELRQEQYQQLRPEVKLLLRRQQRLERLTGQLRNLSGSASEIPRSLARIAEALPESVWLTRLDVARNGAVEMVLEGKAPSFQEVTKLIDSFKTLEGVSHVKPLTSAIVPAAGEAKESVSFSAQIQWLGSSP